MKKSCMPIASKSRQKNRWAVSSDLSEYPGGIKNLMKNVQNRYGKVSEILQVQNALRKLIGQKLVNDGYYDLSELDFSKYKGSNVYTFLNDCDKYAKKLFEKDVLNKRNEIKNSGLSKEEIENRIVDLWLEIFDNTSDMDEMSTEEALAIIYWINGFYVNKLALSKGCKRIIHEILKKAAFFFPNRSEYEYLNNTLIIYDVKRVEPLIVESLPEFMNKVFELSKVKNDNLICYRGHGSVNYLLLPQIYRKNSKGEYSYFEKEKEMYNEIQVKCFESFQQCKTHLEKLEIMQHYEIPTRLMDVTGNPLVAVYFACKKTSKEIGEVIILSVERDKIKWPSSDTVSILSSLAALSYEDKQKLTNNTKSEAKEKSKAKLLGEIRNEKPAFVDQIQMKDCSRIVYINAPMNNKRIINQQGAFLIYGLQRIKNTSIKNGNRTAFREKTIDIVNDFRLNNDQNKRVVLLIKNKKTNL